MALYAIREYESAGVWRDTTGMPCLVIRAKYKEKGEPAEYATHMLYEATRRPTEAAVYKDDLQSLWVVHSVGTGGHLSKAGQKVLCDGPCRGPPPVPKGL